MPSFKLCLTAYKVLLHTRTYLGIFNYGYIQLLKMLYQKLKCSCHVQLIVLDTYYAF